MVLALNDNHQAAVPIPAGKVVDILPSDRDDRFVVIKVDDGQFLAFASDVDEAVQIPRCYAAVTATDCASPDTFPRCSSANAGSSARATQ